MTTESSFADRLREMAADKAAAEGRTATIPDQSQVPTAAEMKAFGSTSYFDAIRKNPSPTIIAEAADYYRTACVDSTRYIVPRGTLETKILELPGITHFYHSISVDAVQCRRWLEEHVGVATDKKQIWFMQDAEAKSLYGKLGVTEAGKMAKIDDEIVELNNLVRQIAYYCNQLAVVLETLEQMKYSLNSVVKLRTENLEDVWVDVTAETKPE